MWRKSLKGRLTIYFTLPILVAVLVVGSVSVRLAYDEVRKSYDTKLEHAARLIFALLRAEQQTETITDHDEEAIISKAVGLDDDSSVFFRIWKNDKLIIYTGQAYDFGNERKRSDFSSEIIDGTKWRFRVITDSDATYTLEVAHKFGIREFLFRKNSMVNLFPFILLLPIIFIITMKGMRRSIQPLIDISKTVKSRSDNDLTPLSVEHPIPEIMPLIDAINRLLANLKNTLNKERRFTDYAAHELRTPIAILKTQAQTALKSTNDSERQQIMETQIQAANRAGKMIDQLLALAHLENFNVPMKLLPLNCIVESIVKEKRPFAKQKPVFLHYAGEETAFIYGNEELVTIILNNLIDNAIKYTPKHENITVKILLDDRVTLKVSDMGPGIPEDKLPYVTESFYRLPGQHQPGAGLGLAIVKRESELMQATLILQNKDAGQGFEAMVLFPVSSNI